MPLSPEKAAVFREVHPLGKGEVRSSILRGSTSARAKIQKFRNLLLGAIVTATALALSACSNGQVFVWTVRDIIGLSFLALIAGGFLLFWVAIFAATAWVWVAKRVKRIFRVSP